jgi:hypothetical protein
VRTWPGPSSSSSSRKLEKPQRNKQKATKGKTTGLFHTVALAFTLIKKLS